MTDYHHVHGTLAWHSSCAVSIEILQTACRAVDVAQDLKTQSITPPQSRWCRLSCCVIALLIGRCLQMFPNGLPQVSTNKVRPAMKFIPWQYPMSSTPWCVTLFLTRIALCVDRSCQALVVSGHLCSPTLEVYRHTQHIH